MSAKYKSPSFLLPNELNTNTNPLNTDGNTATGTGVNSLYSIDFDSSNSDYIESSSSGITGNQNRTISVWAKATSANNKTIICLGEKTGTATASRFGIILRDSQRIQIITYANDVFFDSSLNWGTINLNDGNWHHYLVTFESGNTFKLYVDNTYIGLKTASASSLNTGSGLFIGAASYGAGPQRFFDGLIDEVAIFNRALNTTEIAALYGGTSPNIYPSNIMATDLNPIAYYPLGEQAQNSGYPSATGNEWQFSNGVLQDYVMDFDGSTDYIDISESNDFLGSLTSGTLSFWIKPAIISGTQTIFGYGNTTTTNDFFSLSTFTGGKLRLLFRNDSSGTAWPSNGCDLRTTAVISASEWCNVCLVSDGSSYTLYLNGSPTVLGVDAGSNSGKWFGDFSGITMNKTLIGAKQSTSIGSYFNGEISNVVLWNSDQSANIANIYNNGSPQTSYTVSPQNWWKLNADSVYTPSAPNYTKALDFVANGDTISIPDSNDLDLSGTDFSISFWVNPNSISGSQMILQKYSGSTGWAIYNKSTDNSLQFYQAGSFFALDTNSIDNNIWSHYVVTANVSASEYKIYKNGSLINTISRTVNITSSTQPLYIGSLGGTGFYYNGLLSNIAIFNSTLSASQVSTLFNFGTPETNISFNPQAWWKLDDQTAITDSSGNGHTGTNNGATDALGGVAVTPSWKIPSALTIPTINYTTALDFDKSNTDNINMGSPTSIQNLTNITISVWVKVPSTFSLPYYTVASKGEYGAPGSQWYLTIKTGNSDPGGSFAIYKTSNSTSATSVQYTTNIDDNKWHNIICINDGTDLKVYIDGQPDGTNPGNGGNIYNGNRDLKIGRLTASSIRNFDGLMSNMVIWGDSQEDEVSNIYNNGQPATSYTNTPVSWWKLDTGGSTIIDYGSGGNNGTNSGADKVESNVYVGNVPVNGVSTTLPSTALQQSDLQFDSPYSNYSLSFDGTTNFIDCGANENILDFSGNDYTVSTWVNWNGTGDANQMIASVKSGGIYVDFVLSIQQSTGKIIYWNGSTQVFSNSAIPTNAWCMVTIIIKAGQKDFFINGVADGTPSQARSAAAASGTSFLIGKSNHGSEFFNGKIDETSIFNYELTEAQVLEIYNNGRPKDLSTFSGTAPISWWRLGENAYFQDTTLVLPNSITGAPNGEASTNNVEMISADAPGTYANGIGTNLDILDRVGDAPLSTSNSQSYNMIPSDISPYVPEYVGDQIANNFSMSFDAASNTSFNAGNTSVLSFERTNPFTISAWVKTNATATQVILNKLISNVGYQFFINSAGKLAFYAIQSGSVYIQKNTTATFNDNTWHHVVVTYDGSSNRSGILIYENGNAAATTDVGSASLNSTIVNTANVNIGSSFTGEIDEVAIFDTALNAGQIYNDIYQPTKTGTNQTADLVNNPNLPNPVAWYRMGD